MEIKDNEFSRQFETTVNDTMMSVEYSRQERKIFLTKINVPEGIDEDDEIVSDFLKEILAIAEEKRLRVVPTYPKIAAFFKKNPGYKEMLPPGIRI
ncbi:GNAT family N-acetyltransferase [Flavobacterium beibuense]|uniref:Acetyltransferase n=1 Tax=Flavobacterium beibuense F44-8 TaxID=1406840 RepID=A0A0A2LVW1_9FLAO|nr:N-acetyltransferase [Flavobacterium beibuense]KGO84502.1 acetyltransferase [Flavobacterium beibuense F44-8]